MWNTVAELTTQISIWGTFGNSFVSYFSDYGTSAYDLSLGSRALAVLNSTSSAPAVGIAGPRSHLWMFYRKVGWLEAAWSGVGCPSARLEEVHSMSSCACMCSMNILLSPQPLLPAPCPCHFHTSSHGRTFLRPRGLRCHRPGTSSWHCCPS